MGVKDEFLTSLNAIVSNPYFQVFCKALRVRCLLQLLQSTFIFSCIIGLPLHGANKLESAPIEWYLYSSFYNGFFSLNCAWCWLQRFNRIHGFVFKSEQLLRLKALKITTTKQKRIGFKRTLTFPEKKKLLIGVRCVEIYKKTNSIHHNSSNECWMSILWKFVRIQC